MYDAMATKKFIMKTSVEKLLISSFY